MARRSLTSATNTDDAASFTTDSISPRTDALGMRIYRGALRFLNRLRAAV